MTSHLLFFLLQFLRLSGFKVDSLFSLYFVFCFSDDVFSETTPLQQAFVPPQLDRHEIKWWLGVVSRRVWVQNQLLGDRSQSVETMSWRPTYKGVA